MGFPCQLLLNKMWLMRIVFLFVLVQVISCQNYDELARDECFKKVYVCGDYRVSVTGGTGRLATEPHRFSEICRKHKEFIACVEQAAEFCSDNMTDIARMILDNRRSLKLFCTNFEWRRNYFSSAKCINENEKAVAEECIKEEEEYKDDRPYWCLIPEPCEALERVFLCTVRKIKQLCGSVAAEVHRRMHILKMENRDVVCEIRQRNPMYCRYQRQRPSRSESVKRIGSLSVALSKAINNVFESALVDTMDHFALLLNEENISNLFESNEYQLRQAMFKKEIDDKFGPFFKKCKLPKGGLSRQPDLSARRFSLLFGNIKKILTDATSQSSTFGSTFYENILKLCGTENVMLANCLEKLNELEVLKTINPLAGISQELNVELKSLKDYIIDLVELLNCNEDFMVNSISEETALISWDNMDSFPLQTLSCEWKNVKVFQCSFKLKPSDLTHEVTQPDNLESTIVESTVKSENVNEFIKPFILESSEFTDSGSGMVGDFIVMADEQEIALDSSTIDTLTSEVDVFDIHRSGEQLVIPEEIDSEEVLNEEFGDIKLKSSDDSKQNVNELHKNSKEHSMEETYILINPPYSPTDSVNEYLVVDATTNRENPYLDTLESSTSNANSESSEVDTEEYNVENENLKLQLRKIMGALNDRFSNVEVKIFNSKEGSNSFSRKRQLEYYSDSINKSFQTELESFLKDKMNEYIDMYSIYSKPPTNTESKIRGDRTKRGVVNERQNSKLDKSFSTEASNESVRTNSKFMNFKAEL